MTDLTMPLAQLDLGNVRARRCDPRNLYFLGKRASSARRVGIGVARTCSNESFSVSVLPHRTNPISTTSNPSPFNSARFSGPMSKPHLFRVQIRSTPPTWLERLRYSCINRYATVWRCVCRTVRSFTASVTEGSARPR